MVVLGALFRGTLTRRVNFDFGRVITMWTASDSDMLPERLSMADSLCNGQDAGYDASVRNMMYLAGVQVVQGITGEWENMYAKGIEPQNIGTLGCNPPFGLGTHWCFRL
ncbi:hypothetical protein DICSQDRAFT_155675 [Dichomitus squalens LYAD-421 SS1]|uniref:Uncharacterized protein n=2 Tax=Dichomitus squalens TaxID=114155 RepID=A0A4Q9MPK6_9APHY|nr:uncharacterized protein DICSQDRAFT_155675 [Dichomitus squalens LYAD-421 SS1]EJF60534.1 hypothetical protein DICSQDRAFT_155675 [Dichomitus squalens LYAD-421 SS1]TBU28046.1 hypothetical protein BD311DRAFT_353005 [Dichomitus squalens]